MRRLPLVLLASIIPVTALVSLLIRAERPLDPVMVPLQALFMGLFIYHVGLVFFGVQAPEPLPATAPRSRFAVLSAAHDEEAVIASLVASVRHQDYPADLVRIFVVADHCTDRTAEVARAAGAVVHERRGAARRGKGPALDWLLQRLWGSGERFDAVAIFDADNLVAPAFLRTMDAHLQRGDQVIQGYLGTKNPNDSWITRAIYITYVNSNRFFQLAKHTTGLSSALGGTGLCIAVPLLRRLGWQCHSLTEDLEFQIRAILAGVRPAWGWGAVVYDEKPLTFAGAIRQRQRWMQGHANVAMRYLGPLLWRAIRSRDPVAWDAVIYLGNPIWLAIAFVVAFVHFGNQFAPAFTFLYPGWLPPLLIASALFLPYLALRLEGLSTKVYLNPSTLAGCVLLAMCWPALGFLGLLQHRRRHWVKTVHTRNLSIAESRRQQADLAEAAPRWVRTGAVRAVAGAMIVVAIIATVTPHLVARRLRPPLEEGAVLLLEGRTRKAIDRFASAVDEQPNDPIARGFLALAYRVAGDGLRALREYRRTRQLDPKMETTVVAMVDFLLRHRRHRNAESLLVEMLRMARAGPEGHASVANMFIDRARLHDAETIVQDGLRRYGPGLALLKVQGYLHVALQRYPQALGVLQQAHRLAPRDSGILVNMGWAYVRLGNLDATIQTWERALAFDPRNDALRRDLEWAKRLRAQQQGAAVP